jgi:hypothetical protein
MPQTLSDQWRGLLGPHAERIHAKCLHLPGNLTLSAYNQELWNHPFKTKCDRYAQSNIVLTRELANYELWGEDNIEKRGRQLAKEAARIWTGPKDPISLAVTEDDADTVGRHELRLQFWTGLSDYLIAEHSKVPQFEARPNSTLRLPSGVRQLGFELRLGLRRRIVGIDIWFWRAASRSVWDDIRTQSETYDAMIGTSWSFDRERACMFLDRPTENLRSDSTWPEVYRWFGEHLSVLYEKIAPKLREEFDRADALPLVG